MHNLIKKFSHVFIKHEYDFEHNMLMEYKVNVEGHSPVKPMPYRVPYKQTLDTVVKETVDRWIARRLESSWFSSVVFALKKGESYRFCVGYRKINVTKKGSYPLPRTGYILRTISDAAYFSTLDQANGYQQVNIADADKEKTVFIIYIQWTIWI